MTTTRLPTLAAWMRRGLYDPGFGYYSAGRVRFGHDDDFWTFPQELSPVFGTLLAERIAEMALVLQAAGHLGPETPLTIVELGAGDGTLARDVLDALDAATSARPSSPLARGHALARARLHYRVGERSPALRAQQRRAWGPHADAAGWGGAPRVTHLPQATTDIVAELPEIVGAVVHNELIDVFPHERLRLGERPEDDEVLALEARTRAADGRASSPLDAAALWQACEARVGEDVGEPLQITPRWVPGLGEAVSASDWLQTLRPLAREAAARMRDREGQRGDRQHADPEHADTRHAAEPDARAMPWICPGIDPLLDAVSSALRAGWMWTVDYGGSALHTLDPAPSMPALRCYPALPVLGMSAEATRALPAALGWPGSRDVTLDIDFSHVAHAGQRGGLQPVFFGPQVSLRTPSSPTEPLAADVRRRVEDRHRARAGVGAIEAARRVWSAASRFGTGSPGFRLLVQRTANVPADALRFPLSTLPVLPADLRWPSLAVTEAPQALRALLSAAIEDAGLGDGPDLLQAGVGAVLDAATRPASLPLLLDERGLRHATAAIDAALRERGWM